MVKDRNMGKVACEPSVVWLVTLGLGLVLLPMIVVILRRVLAP